MTEGGVAVAPAPVLVPILWMDDEPEALQDIKALLSKERSKLGIEIEIAGSVEEARHKLEEGDYAALVVDCNMEKRGLESNGAKFLFEVNQSHKSLPTFVYSAYLDHPYYEGYLRKSYPILKESKTRAVDPPLSKDPFFRELSRRAQDHFAIRNLYPDRIEFSAYCQNPTKYSTEVEAHWRKHGHWISAEMTRMNHLWCVVCGEQIAEGSGDLFDFPNEETLRAVGEKYNRIPFAYTASLPPEDSTTGRELTVAWHETNFQRDYYPTVGVRIEDRSLQDDFDTGAIQTHVSSELVLKGMFNFWRESEASHLGELYRYFAKKLKVSLLSSEGAERSREMPVIVVENWAESPFTRVKKTRRCLLGRDLLRGFRVEITLDSVKRTTRVRFLD